MSEQTQKREIHHEQLRVRFPRLERLVASAALLPTVAIGITACGDMDRFLGICDPGSELRQTTNELVAATAAVEDLLISYADDEDVNRVREQVEALPDGPVADRLLYALDLAVISNADEVDDDTTSITLGDTMQLTTDAAEPFAVQKRDAVLADAALDQFYDVAQNQDEVTASIDAIETPEHKRFLERAYEARLAYDLVDDPGSSMYDWQESLRLAMTHLQDAELSSKVGHLLDEIMQLDDTESMYAYVYAPSYQDTVSALYGHYSLKEAEARELIGWPHEVDESIKQAAYDVTNDTQDGAQDAIADHNRLDETPEALTDINLAIEDNRTLDVSRVGGDLICQPEWLDDTREARRFLGIAVEDGSVTATYAEGAVDQLSPEDKAAIDLLLERLRPIIEVAYNEGKILEIQVMVDANDNAYNGYYVHANREISIILPTSGKVSIDQLQGTILHEIMHAVEDDVLDSFVDAPEEQAQMRDGFIESCTSIVRDDVSSTLEYPDMQPTIESLAQSNAEYGVLFAEMHRMIQEQGTSGLADLIAPNYFCTMPEAGDYLYVVGKQLEMDVSDINDAVDAFNDTARDDESTYSAKALNFLNTVYDRSHDGTLGRLFNESQYVDTTDSAGAYLGHVDDNEAELFASAMNVSLLYQDQVSEKIQALDEDTRNKVREVLRHAYAIASHELPTAGVYFGAHLEALLQQQQ